MRLPLLALAAALAGCASAPPATAPAAAGFVTTLGDDTLAVERFTRTADGIDAVVALRAPRTTLTSYRLDLDADGGLTGYEATARQPLTGETLRRTTAEPVGDSLRLTRSETMGETSTRTVAGADRPLPFIDMVHWPFELMVERAVAAGGPLDQPLFTERGTVGFTSDVEPDGTVIVRHPFRGPMTVQADAQGRLQMLDAGATTRKLVVRRVADVDVEAMARRFAERDAAGMSIGELSGRGESFAEVGGATVSVDYGQPRMRGREIWGALVPWGELWRTGANQATHVETTRALVLDPDGAALAVPAGRYTLYSIPAPDGGVLIVNRQTGQGGTTYDESHDLGRVPLVRRSEPTPVEAFTIDVEPVGSGTGEIVLRWDREAFAVPFAVAE